MYSFNDYQKDTASTAVYPKEAALVYLLLGLCSEVGEVQAKYKRIIRDGTQLDINDLAYELGDVLWYLTRLADENGLSLEGIAALNYTKLRNRQEKNTLQGEGDNR